MVVAGALRVVALAVVVMVMLMLVVVMMVVVLLVVMVAAALVMVMLMFVVIVIIVVVMAAAAVALVLIVVMMMVMLVMVIMVIMVIMVVVVMVVLRLLRLVLGLHPGQQLIGQRDLFHSGQQSLAVQLVPRGSEDGGGGILLSQQSHGGLQLLLRQLLCPGEDDGAGRLDLIVVELTEVLHIHLHLGGVGHGDEGVQLHVRLVPNGVLHRHDHVGELAYAGGLDEDAVRSELLMDLAQGLVKVAHQRAADAAGGHLADLHAGILQETAVDADLAKLVFNEHQLLTLIGLAEHLLDERGLTGAQKTRYNVDFCHKTTLLFSSAMAEDNLSLISYPIFPKMQEGGTALHRRGGKLFLTGYSYGVILYSL